MTREWLTVKQAAARAQVSEATIRREVKACRITVARIGGRRSLRFKATWVDEWLDVATSPAIQHVVPVEVTRHHDSRPW
jgi:excisionase family DNA binding protein